MCIWEPDSSNSSFFNGLKTFFLPKNEGIVQSCGFELCGQQICENLKSPSTVWPLWCFPDLRALHERSQMGMHCKHQDESNENENELLLLHVLLDIVHHEVIATKFIWFVVFAQQTFTPFLSPQPTTDWSGFTLAQSCVQSAN